MSTKFRTVRLGSKNDLRNLQRTMKRDFENDFKRVLSGKRPLNNKYKVRFK